MRFDYFIENLDRCQSCVDPAIRDLKINSELRKSYYISKSGAGFKECVLVADGKVPDHTIESQLYFGFGKNKFIPIVDASNPEEVHFYINKSLKIIFTTRVEDIRFHSRYPGVKKRIVYEMEDLF